MDEDGGPVIEYKPNIYYMQNVLWAIGFICYVFLAYVWSSYDYYNSWFAWGGWIWLGMILLFRIAPLVIENRSPKIITNIIGTSIASPDPVVKIPPEAGYPEMGIYLARTFRGLGIIEFAMSCRAYIIAPTALMSPVGEAKKGVNVFGNCWLEPLRDHTQLAPHILDRLRGMKKNLYDPDKQVFTGLFPIMVNTWVPEKLEEYRKRCLALGIPEETFKVHIKQMLEQSASELTMFRYGEDFMKPEATLNTILKEKNSHIDDLRKRIETYRTEITAHTQLFRYGEEEPMPRGWRERMIPQREEREPPDRYEEPRRRY